MLIDIHLQNHPGGHTAEMLKLVDSLDKTRYIPRYYVVAETDKMSGKKVVEYEKSLTENAKVILSVAIRHEWHSAPCFSFSFEPFSKMQISGTPKVRYAEVDPASGHEAEAKPFELLEIPRSREVGQSYLSSIWTTLRAQLYAFALVWHVKPQVWMRI